MKRMGITTLTLPFLFLKLLHLPSLERARPHDDRLKTYDHVRKLENERLSFSLSPFTRIQREDFQSFSSFLFFYIYRFLLSSGAHQQGFPTGSRRSWIRNKVQFPSLLRSIFTILNILLHLRSTFLRSSFTSSSFIFPFFTPAASSTTRKGLIVPLTRCVYALSTLIMNAPVSFADYVLTRRRKRRLGSFNPKRVPELLSLFLSFLSAASFGRVLWVSWEWKDKQTSSKAMWFLWDNKFFHLVYEWVSKVGCFG